MSRFEGICDVGVVTLRVPFLQAAQTAITHEEKVLHWNSSYLWIEGVRLLYRNLCRGGLHSYPFFLM